MTMADKLIAAGFDAQTAQDMSTQFNADLVEAQKALTNATEAVAYWTAEQTKWAAEVNRLTKATADPPIVPAPAQVTIP